jgi:mannose-6-phosphate isomerase-like protein (cupin superfamily)
VSEGTAGLTSLDNLAQNEVSKTIFLKEHHQTTIFKEQWHQLINTTEKPVKIVEIQYGDKCDEDDIERQDV